MLSFEHIVQPIISWLEQHPAISGLIASVIGAVLSAIFDLRKKAEGFYSVIKNTFIDKSERRLSADKNSGAFTQETTGIAAPQGGSGNHQSIKIYYGVPSKETARAADPAEALTIPKPLASLTGEPHYICHELQKRFPSNTLVEKIRTDYEEASAHLQRNDLLSAASLYVTVYLNIISLTQRRNFFGGEDAIKAHTKLQEYVSTLDRQLSNRETIPIDFYKDMEDQACLLMRRMIYETN